MKTIRFADGTAVPALGQGTWMMGERAERRRDEIAALREGIDLGMTLIDTAEMYGEGDSERLVGEAIKGLRDRVFLVSKAYPQNAARTRLRGACEASLRRLGTDHLDLYLLHWRGAVPLAETVEAMEQLIADGLIARWGVSNLDEGDMEALTGAGGDACATNQILYNPSRRGPEFDLMPWLARHAIAVMAYSPIEQGRLLADRTMIDIGERHGASAAQVALAWLLRQPNVLPIPKSGSVAHVRENRAAADLVLSDEDIADIDRAFPAPSRAQPLDML